MKNNPIVSVIIPTYKREIKYLSRALKSIKIQTYPNIEIIVVDDNFSNSVYRHEVVKFMEQFIDDSNVVYYQNTANIGGALARNNGIAIAKGDYITFLDDDDEYLPNKIGRQVNFMIDNNCDMSFTNLIIMNNKKVIVDIRNYSYVKDFDKKALLKYHIMHHLTGTPTYMFKSSKLREIRGFEDVEIGQEFHLMMKAIENDLKICYLNEYDVIAHRHNHGSISQGENKIQGEISLYNYKKKHYKIFSFRERRFIRFRHYAVMSVAYKRNRQYFKFFLFVLITFFSSPIYFITETVRFIKKINKERYI